MNSRTILQEEIFKKLELTREIINDKDTYVKTLEDLLYFLNRYNEKGLRVINLKKNKMKWKKLLAQKDLVALKFMYEAFLGKKNFSEFLDSEFITIGTRIRNIFKKMAYHQYVSTNSMDNINISEGTLSYVLLVQSSIYIDFFPNVGEKRIAVLNKALQDSWGLELGMWPNEILEYSNSLKYALKNHK